MRWSEREINTLINWLEKEAIYQEWQIKETIEYIAKILREKPEYLHSFPEYKYISLEEYPNTTIY